MRAGEGISREVLRRFRPVILLQLTLLCLLVAPALLRAVPVTGAEEEEGIRVIQRRPARQVRVHWQARADRSGVRVRLYRGTTLTSLDLVAETEATQGLGSYQHQLQDLAEQAVFYQLRVVMPGGREYVLGTVLAVVEQLLPDTLPQSIDSNHLSVAIQAAGLSMATEGSTGLEPGTSSWSGWGRPSPPPPPPRSC